MIEAIVVVQAIVPIAALVALVLEPAEIIATLLAPLAVGAVVVALAVTGGQIVLAVPVTQPTAALASVPTDRAVPVETGTDAAAAAIPRPVVGAALHSVATDLSTLAVAGVATIHAAPGAEPAALVTTGPAVQHPEITRAGAHTILAIPEPGTAALRIPAADTLSFRAVTRISVAVPVAGAATGSATDILAGIATVAGAGPVALPAAVERLADIRAGLAAAAVAGAGVGVAALPLGSAIATHAQILGAALGGCSTVSVAAGAVGSRALARVFIAAGLIQRAIPLDPWTTHLAIHEAVVRGPLTDLGHTSAVMAFADESTGSAITTIAAVFPLPRRQAVVLSRGIADHAGAGARVSDAIPASRRAIAAVAALIPQPAVRR